MIRLFARFVGAFFRSVWWRVRGWEILAERKTVRDRDNTCGVCPYRDDDVCSICGCPILSKITLASEQCPKKYWLREKVATHPGKDDC